MVNFMSNKSLLYFAYGYGAFLVAVNHWWPAAFMTFAGIYFIVGLVVSVRGVLRDGHRLGYWLVLGISLGGTATVFCPTSSHSHGPIYLSIPIVVVDTVSTQPVAKATITCVAGTRLREGGAERPQQLVTTTDASGRASISVWCFEDTKSLSFHFPYYTRKVRNRVSFNNDHVTIECAGYKPTTVELDHRFPAPYEYTGRKFPTWTVRLSSRQNRGTGKSGRKIGGKSGKSGDTILILED